MSLRVVQSQHTMPWMGRKFPTQYTCTREECGEDEFSEPNTVCLSLLGLLAVSLSTVDVTTPRGKPHSLWLLLGLHKLHSGECVQQSEAGFYTPMVRRFRAPVTVRPH